MGRTKKNNKFDTPSAKSGSTENAEITSASALKAFVQLAKKRFMRTDRGEFAFLEILETYIPRVQKQKRLFEQQREFVSIEYLTELDSILKEARADLNQAIRYKYNPIELFNNSEGVDVQFKEFVIKYVVEHYSQDILAVNSKDIFTSHSQLHGNNPRLTDLQKDNRQDFIVIVKDAFKIEQEILHKAAAGLIGFEELCRVIHPVVNKIGNELWNGRLGRELWSKESKNSEKHEDSLFIEKVNKRKNN